MFVLARFVQYPARDYRGNLAAPGQPDCETEPIVAASGDINLHLALELGEFAASGDSDGEAQDTQRLLVVLVEWHQHVSLLFNRSILLSRPAVELCGVRGVPGKITSDHALDAWRPYQGVGPSPGPGRALARHDRERSAPRVYLARRLGKREH